MVNVMQRTGHHQTRRGISSSSSSLRLFGPGELKECHVSYQADGWFSVESPLDSRVEPPVVSYGRWRWISGGQR